MIFENRRQTQIKNIVKWFFPLIFPFIIYWLLFSRIRTEDFFVAMKNASISWLALGFVAYSANQVFRTMRFHCLIHTRIPDMKQLFRVQSLYIFFNYLLPFRTGEATYVFLARRHLNIPVANGISSLVVARISDYLLLIICCLVITLSMELSLSPWISMLMKGGIAFLFLAIALFLLFRNKKNKIIVWIKERSFFLRLRQNSKIIHKLSGEFQNIIQSFREICTTGIALKTAFYTLCTWMCIFLAFYMITRGLGYSVGFLPMITVSVIAVMSRAFQGIADFGSHEMGWFGGLILIGFSSTDAGIVSFSSHIIILCYMLIVTLYSRVTLKKHGMIKQITFSKCETGACFHAEK